jgi:hypothetical protein
MRCGQKETLSPIQIAEGEVQANIDHINRCGGGLLRIVPACNTRPDSCVCTLHRGWYSLVCLFGHGCCV